MNSSKRRELILARLAETGAVSVTELAQLTAAVELTIRRDLDLLERQGALKRIRGGAVALAGRGSSAPFETRRAQRREVKAQLAAAVADLVADGESILLDNGTTCLAVAEELATRPLTVMPISVQAAAALAVTAGTQVVLPAGRVANGELAIWGAETVDTIRHFNADTAIISSCAASPRHGLTCAAADEAPVKRALVAAAARTLLVIEAAKLTRTSTFRFAELEEVDVLITELRADEATVRIYRDRGIDVVQVG